MNSNAEPESSAGINPPFPMAGDFTFFGGILKLGHYLMLDAVSDDDLKAIVAAMVARVKAQDVAAVKLLLSYMIGKPTDAPDPDRLDVDAMGIEADAIVTANKCRLNRPSALDLAMDDLGG